MARNYTKLTSLQVFKRDNILTDFIKAHRGAENAVAAALVCEHLANLGYPTKLRNVGNIVNKLMYERVLPICYINGKGYYWAKTRAEIEQTIADLRSRMNALQEHINHLSGFLIER